MKEMQKQFTGKFLGIWLLSIILERPYSFKVELLTKEQEFNGKIKLFGLKNDLYILCIQKM